MNSPSLVTMITGCLRPLWSLSILFLWHSTFQAFHSLTSREFFDFNPRLIRLGHALKYHNGQHKEMVAFELPPNATLRTST
jgi:hypothetical protein